MKKAHILPSLILVFSIFVTFTTLVNAQTIEETKKKAFELINQNKFFEALPYVEKLVADNPNNATFQRYLGFGYIAKIAIEQNSETKKEFRIKARKALIKARELGYNDLQMEALIDSLAADGSEKGKFSFNKQAEKLMTEAESYFAQGKLDEALDKYQEALNIDPTIYYAALFSGDVYMNKEDFAQAEIWYKKAIAINPYIETAYRYSATPLMKQQKYDEARTRYIEAYITAPYDKLAISGLVNWGQITKTPLTHPRIDIPEFKIGADGKATSTININPGNEDASIAWIGYSATRSVWLEKKFYDEFPNEPRYRHSLREEIEALQSVIKVANELKGKKTTLNPQLENLINLDKDGLLESYILLAKADNGLAREYFDYLKKNRDKLRQYVLKYVIKSENSK
jgi:tetratricopeptide (TPR) repeat protein